MGDLFYTIHWRSKLTGKTGAGSSAFPREYAQHVADRMARDSDELLQYWIEPAANPPAPLPQPEGKSDE